MCSTGTLLTWCLKNKSSKASLSWAATGWSPSGSISFVESMRKGLWPATISLHKDRTYMAVTMQLASAMRMLSADGRHSHQGVFLRSTVSRSVVTKACCFDPAGEPVPSAAACPFKSQHCLRSLSKQHVAGA